MSPAQGIGELWPEGAPLLGVVHLPALPGAPRWTGSIDGIADHAVEDAAILADAGFHGVVVENYGDVPFHAARVPAETVAAMARVTSAVVARVGVPVGVNVLRNDALAAIGIAAATGARFIRVNVHTGSMWTDQGLVEGRAADTLRKRATLAPDVVILADVHVKHATPPAGASLADAARDCWHRGLADALVVSGTGTGSAAAHEDLKTVRAAVPAAPLLVGSGVDAGTVAEMLRRADGLIVGTAVMEGARPGGRIDPERARAFVAAATA